MHEGLAALSDPRDRELAARMTPIDCSETN